MIQRKNHFNAYARHEKPYYYFSDYLWDAYRCKILKLPINVNLSCPNRDGTLGESGCIYCSPDGSASPGTNSVDSVHEQISSAKKKLKRYDARTRYIAYFQAFTNTHAAPSILRKLYDQAIQQENIVGLMIGTRPDCLPEETLDLIASYKKRGFELWLEIGMQTIHDRSLDFLGRCHTNASTIDAIARAAARGIPVCVHLILGIPGETWNDIMATAEAMRDMPVRGVKFHQLHVIRGTRLEELFLAGRVTPLSQSEYVSILCDFIERISPDILIHRFMGDREENTLVAPLWGLRKGTVMKAIDEEFKRRGTFQGFLYNDDVLTPGLALTPP